MAQYLLPYEFSISVLLASALALVLYAKGAWNMARSGTSISLGRGISFVLGVLLIYAVLQTYIDYLSQHMFWMHRVQHLVLHHLGPFLIMLAMPHKVMGAALPATFFERYWHPLWNNPVVRSAYRFIQHPVIAPLLFVGLIYLWLIPSLHFDAMLSVEMYKLMNWGMAIDGLLFWWLILDPSTAHVGAVGYGTRVLMLGVIMFPQILIGAYISLSSHIIYDVYNVCGRAWPIKPLLDQQIGGLTTWIPASMMSVVGALVVLRYWHRDSRLPHAARLGTPHG